MLQWQLLSSTKRHIDCMPAPHLSAALSGPILNLERCILILDAMSSIEHGLRNQWQKHAAPFYCSVDLHNSGFKLAPLGHPPVSRSLNNLNPRVYAGLCIGNALAAAQELEKSPIPASAIN